MFVVNTLMKHFYNFCDYYDIKHEWENIFLFFSFLYCSIWGLHLSEQKWMKPFHKFWRKLIFKDLEFKEASLFSPSLSLSLFTSLPFFSFFFFFPFWSLISLRKTIAHSLCPTLCDPVECSPSGYCVHGVSQARILEWVAISFSRGCSWPRERTRISHGSCAGRRILSCAPPGKLLLVSQVF